MLIDKIIHIFSLHEMVNTRPILEIYYTPIPEIHYGVPGNADGYEVKQR